MRKGSENREKKDRRRVGVDEEAGEDGWGALDAEEEDLPGVLELGDWSRLAG